MVPPGEGFEHARSVRLIRGLAEDLIVQTDDGVRRDDDVVLPCLRRDLEALGAREALCRLAAGDPRLGMLLAKGGADGQLQSEAFQKLSASWGGRSKYHLHQKISK